MKSGWINCALVIGILSSAATHADVWVFDINDTITLCNAIDPEKTPQVVNYQLVAQNTFLEKEPHISIESHIKKTIPSKSGQRQAYGNLPQYAEQLYRENLISLETFEAIPVLSDKYQQALEKTNAEENEQFFPSLFAHINYILEVDLVPTIIFQSFGKEIPLALGVIERRFQGKLAVISEIGRFDDYHHLHFQGKVYETPSQMSQLLTSHTVMGWQNNYAAKGKKILFFQDTPSNSLKTHFYDDNADQFTIVSLNGQLLSQEEGYRFAKSYIHKVDTGKALTEEDYFTNLHR